MQMLHRLTAILTDIRDDAVAVGKRKLLGDLGNTGKNMSNERSGLLRDLVCRADVRLRDHEHMYGRLGLNVVKGENKLVLVYLF